MVVKLNEQIEVAKAAQDVLKSISGWANVGDDYIEITVDKKKFEQWRQMSHFVMTQPPWANS